MIKINKHIFDDRERLFDQLLKDIIRDLEGGISDRDAASMLLSGGTTPGPLYEKMSDTEFSWEKVIFSPTDERWVEADHPDSNEKLIRDTLIKGKASEAGFIGLKSAGAAPSDGQKETEEKLASLPLPLDVVLLGMGEDGHVASLFPGLQDTKYALSDDCASLCHGIHRDGDDVDRMTLTLKCLLSSKRIYLLFFGGKKLEVFEKATTEKSGTLPVSYLLYQDDVPVSVYWAE